MPCAALNEEGEIFFHFNRTLFQHFMVACTALTEEEGEIFFHFNRKFFQDFMVACAALNEEGEIFFHFNRTLFQHFMVACAALTEGGEIVLPSIGHCFKTLIKVNTNNIFQSRRCDFDPS